MKSVRDLCQLQFAIVEIFNGTSKNFDLLVRESSKFECYDDRVYLRQSASSPQFNQITFL